MESNTIIGILGNIARPANNAIPVYLAGCKAKARGGGKGKVLAVSCARHYCVHCLEVESAGYGKAMVRCVRCVTSYHRACLPRTPLTMITHASFLCHRCYNNSPRGLNAQVRARRSAANEAGHAQRPRPCASTFVVFPQSNPWERPPCRTEDGVDFNDTRRHSFNAVPKVFDCR